jgi:hypothetical protein
MSNIVNLERKPYIGTRRDYEIAVRRRAELMWAKPIHNEEITEIDLWLLHNAHADVTDKIRALSRAIYIYHFLYIDLMDNPDAWIVRQRMLLFLRDQYEEFRKLPEPVHKALNWIWNSWTELFVDEECYGA